MLTRVEPAKPLLIALATKLPVGTPATVTFPFASVVLVNVLPVLSWVITSAPAKGVLSARKTVTTTVAEDEGLPTILKLTISACSCGLSPVRESGSVRLTNACAWACMPSGSAGSCWTEKCMNMAVWPGWIVIWLQCHTVSSLPRKKLKELIGVGALGPANTSAALAKLQHSALLTSAIK